MTAFFDPMKNNKPELLAPAGNYECFLAAVGAGADAVYLAGSRFGARAYAENFTEEQLLWAIRYAHLYDRKLYMTVNTLLKPGEIEALRAYMRPYYEAGLDGVIVQDMGVFRVLQKAFPGMELHCSTQMTLTGVDGAAFAVEAGASRIVPARELTLPEIAQIHERFPELELECFIHGALCYCYSGQCLFSSLIGGRSGNRGTCAQPCRLPYDVMLAPGKTLREKYPLSLKDLSAIRILPELMKAGISSFKIEGRMKSAEYVAGVTGVYRSAIDRYLKDPSAYKGPTQEETMLLSSLYVRSDTEEGYYHHYNGKHMITPDQPSYRGCSEDILSLVRQKYKREPQGIPVQLSCVLKAGCPALLTAVCFKNGREYKVTATGAPVDIAQKKPLSGEDVRRQLLKSGGTAFAVTEVRLKLEEAVFLPVSKLNELRREVLLKLQEALLKKYERIYNKPEQEDGNRFGGPVKAAVFSENNGYTVSVCTEGQLLACAARDFLKRIYVDSLLWDKLLSCPPDEKVSGRIWLDMPRIIRTRNRSRILERAGALLRRGIAKGFRVSSIDGYGLALQCFSESGTDTGAARHGSCRERLIADASLYIMNPEAADFWSERFSVLTLPVELNERELRMLLKNSGSHGSPFEMMIYGRIPLMVTANCIRRSFGERGCEHKPGVCCLKDRKQNRMPVRTDCENCCNIIYNSVPLSLHRQLDKIKGFLQNGSFSMAFTTENKEETDRILSYYENPCGEWSFGDYTNGHFTRGVE